jgi:hypothetical protein
MFDIGPPEFDVPVGLPDPDYPDLGCASWTRSHRIDPDLKIIPWVIAYRIIPEKSEGPDPMRTQRAGMFREWLDEAANAPAFVRLELINPPSKIRPIHGEVASKAGGRVETEGSSFTQAELAMEELRGLLLAHHRRVLDTAIAARDEACRQLAGDLSQGERLRLHRQIRTFTAAIAHREALIIAASAGHPVGGEDE